MLHFTDSIRISLLSRFTIQNEHISYLLDLLFLVHKRRREEILHTLIQRHFSSFAAWKNVRITNEMINELSDREHTFFLLYLLNNLHI